MQNTTTKRIYGIRRGAFYLIITSMLILLAACGSTTTSSSSSSSQATPTPTEANTGGSSGNGGYGSGYGNGASKGTPTPTTTVSGPSKTITITQDSSGAFSFSPKTITISAGTTIIWNNKTSTPHTVTSNTGAFSSGGTATPLAPQSGSYHFTFTKAGTYAYHCEFHPSMTATIMVQ